MNTPTFRIVGPSGAIVADGLPISAPAIQLHEGRVAEPAAPFPKELAPGEFTTVVYPLDAEKGQKRPEMLCTVMRTDAPEGELNATTSRRESAPVDLVIRSDAPPIAISYPPKYTPARGGRRPKGGVSS